MNFIQRIYLKSVRDKLHKPFKPLGIKKRDSFLVSTPHATKEFLKVLSFLGGLRKLGSVILLLPETFMPFVKMLKPNTFQVIYWTKIPQILTREYDLLRKELKNHQCNWLIELSEDANLSLPGLIDVPKRITFYDQKNYPYYNILVKNGIESLMNFLQVTAIEPKSLFKFNKSELKTISKNLPAQHPLLFFNTVRDSDAERIEWSGSVVTWNKAAEGIEQACKKIFLCDAYLGPDDEFCEIARIFNKEIVVK
ncbi:MAG: hypothetical protein ABIL20_02495 [candidate division WOR-3 bacterium]